ncbi:iron ABC transporter permease [Rhodococcus triatomae]|uniref:Iron(III) transport system permease protein n=1 Tax=Rhodococcus triatomae TaxID=300028 RepID=A0A1G8PJ39_9NOCA|nr:iron ABC transporter permease [Rhodococcus triatomae]QNG20121.1 iron ABC transporter permease [Rhodococcus triatomae]QNG23963.1 iron ABC transporter permease [Rhodococcus triatomae]SDI92551.1 iron(III) transport system permease protein [Rhodococcus triatomae]
MTSRSGVGGRPVLGAAAFVIAALTLVPLAYLVIRALDGGVDKAMALLWRQRTLDLTINTVVLTVGVAGICLVAGTALAWLTVRTDLPGRRLLAAALTAPLAIPSYVAGYVWIAEFPGLAGLPGALLVLSVACTPLVMLPVAAALSSMDPGPAEVARTLGRGPIRTVLTVELRRVVPAATAGALLAALYTLSDFGAVALMRYEAFTFGIYNAYRGAFDRTAAAILGVVLVLLALACTLLERRFRRGATARLGTGAARDAEPYRLGHWKFPALAGVGAVLVVSVGVPVLGLTRWMVNSLRLHVDWGEVLATTVATLQLSTVAALVIAIAAFPVALFAAGSRSTMSRATEIAVYVAHGLPGITVGLAVVFFGIRAVPVFYQTTVLLVLAYVVLFLPLAVGSSRTAIESQASSLGDVSRTLGSGRIRTDLRVTIPLAAPGIAAGTALVFLTVAKELPATLMLRPRGVDTLATELWSTAQVFKYGEAAPYALVLILVSVIPTLVLGRLAFGKTAARPPSSGRVNA